jgi:predicted aspartyl protease
MEPTTMGRVIVEAIVENLRDVWDVKRGLLTAEELRRVVLPNALVDTDARSLGLPTRYIRELGLEKVSDRHVTTSTGPAIAAVYDAVRLTIQGRDCVVDVTEVPDSVPPLIGQIPLESLDFVVDPINHRLIGNPAHGGEYVFEMY